MAAKRLTPTQSLKRLLKLPLSGALEKLSPERLERAAAQKGQ